MRIPRVDFSTNLGLVPAGFAALALTAGCTAPVGREADFAAQKNASPPGSGLSCDTVAQPQWSVYGQGLLGQRCVSKSDLPTSETTAGLQVKWENVLTPSIPVSAATTSTPVIAYGHAYYGDHHANFYSVDKETGAIDWQVNLLGANTVFGFDTIRGTAAVTKDFIYVASGVKLWKLDRLSGEVLWDRPLDPHFATLADSSPVVFEDKVIIGVSGVELYLPVDDFTFRGSVVAFDAEDGSELWRTYTTDDDEFGAGVSVWSSAAIDEENRLAFIGTGNSYEAPASPLSDSLLALDVDTGAIVWSDQFVADDVFTPVPVPGPGTDSDVGATPNLFTLEGVDVVGVGSKSGEYKIFERTTGAPVSSAFLTTAVTVALADPNIPDEYGTAFIGGIMGSAAVADGIIYANSNIWFSYEFSRSGTHSPLDTSVTYAIDASTGQPLWGTQLPAPHFGGLTKVNDVIYHTLITGVLVGLDAVTGAIVFWDELPASAGGGVSAQGDSLYVGYGFAFSPEFPVAQAGVRAYSL